MAHSRRAHAHANLAGLRIVEPDVDDLERLVDPGTHCGLRHESSLRRTTIVRRKLQAPLPVFAGRGAYAVPEHDRERQHDARGRQARDAHAHRPRRERRDDADEERDDRDEECQVTDALAERRETRDAGAPGDDWILSTWIFGYQAIHPWAENVSSMAAGRSASAYETRARLTFASK